MCSVEGFFSKGRSEDGDEMAIANDIKILESIFQNSSVSPRVHDSWGSAPG